MPVYLIKCSNCAHKFNGLVMTNTQEPKEWICSQCGGHNAKPIFQHGDEHPLEKQQGAKIVRKELAD